MHQRVEKVPSVPPGAGVSTEASLTSPPLELPSLEECPRPLLPRHRAIPQGVKEAPRVWVEPLLSEAKDWYGSRRFRLRRLEKVNAQALITSPRGRTSRVRSPTLTEARGERCRTAEAAALNAYEFCGVRKHCDRRSQRPASVFNTLGSSRNSGAMKYKRAGTGRPQPPTVASSGIRL